MQKLVSLQQATTQTEGLQYKQRARRRKLSNNIIIIIIIVIFLLKITGNWETGDKTDTVWGLEG